MTSNNLGLTSGSWPVKTPGDRGIPAMVEQGIKAFDAKSCDGLRFHLFGENERDAVKKAMEARPDIPYDIETMPGTPTP